MTDKEKQKKFLKQWLLSDDKEIQERKDIIIDNISYWISKDCIYKEIFDTSFIKAILYYSYFLKPITIQMIDHFIWGWGLKRDKSKIGESEKFTQPLLKKLAEFQSTEMFRNGMIDRFIPKEDTTFLDGKGYKNTRNVFKRFFNSNLGIVYSFDQLEEIEDEIIMSRKQMNNSGLLSGFKCSLSSPELSKACLILEKKAYIEADELNFISAFKDEPIPKNFKPIIWKKISSRNRTINKKALVDLLKILGVKEMDIIKINRLFVYPGGGSINIKSSNIYNNKGKIHSEFYSELKDILSSI